MDIKGRKIGPEHPPLVIAEIGINHGGDLNVAKQLVLAAAQAGCEIVKHQTHFVDDEMTPEAKQIIPPNAENIYLGNYGKQRPVATGRNGVESLCRSTGNDLYLDAVFPAPLPIF